MTDPKPHQAAVRAAEKLCEEYQIGKASEFHDDFCHAEQSALALIITREYEPVVSALKTAADALEWYDGGENKAVAQSALKEIAEALKQLTTTGSPNKTGQ